MEKGKISGISWIAGSWPPGPGRSTLLFIHGAGGSSRLWESQVQVLGHESNTVALDLPGHGTSDPPGRRSVDDYARAVVDFIDAAGLERVIPVGLSMGGAITQTLLLDYKDRFRAGVLVSTGARLKVMPQIFKAIRDDFEGFIGLTERFSISPKTDPELVRPVIEDTRLCEPETVSDDFKACDRFDVMDRLKEVNMPVLVISAEDDRLTPPKYGKYLSDNIEGADRVHIKDSGHLTPAEKPEEVNLAILEFLEGLSHEL